MHTLFTNFVRVEFANPDLQRRAVTTMRLAIALVVLALVFIPVGLTSPQPLVALLTIIIGLALFGGAALLAKRGQPTTASWLIIATFLVTTLGNLIVSSSGSLASGFYLVATVVIAGITMRPAQVWLVVAVNLAAFAAVISTTQAAMLQDQMSALSIYGSAGLMVLVGGIAFIGAQVLRQTLEETVVARATADQAQQALAAANSSLAAQVATQTDALRHALTEQQALAADLHLSLAAQQQLNQAINDLALPIIPISDNTLIVPLTGVVDSTRANTLIHTVLEQIGVQRTRTIILDVTGVPLVDTQVAGALLRTADAARLMGADTILVGIRPEVAQALVDLGVELRGLTTAATLQMALSLTKQPIYARFT